MKVATNPEYGRGLFALRDFAEGDFIVDYDGAYVIFFECVSKIYCTRVNSHEKISKWISKLKGGLFRRLTKEIHDELFAKQTDTKGSYYLFAIQVANGGYVYFDGEKTGSTYEECVCLGGYANHSKKAPNMRPIPVKYSGEYHAIFYATTTIKTGTELLWNYGPDVKFNTAIPKADTYISNSIV